jgi:hypothetical protein
MSMDVCQKPAVVYQRNDTLPISSLYGGYVGKGEKTAENSHYIGLTYFEIKVLTLFFRHPHPERRNAKMKSKQFHHHKLSGLRKLSQLLGKEGQVFAGFIQKKSLHAPFN